MLIYDHTKALIGIDDDDLHLLGFNTANELFASCTDIADFFIKEPGYIHNFKNFEWIDFVLHAESQNSRAIVDTGRKHFTCEILIRPFHLLQTPDREAYAVYLQHVKPLKMGEETKPAPAEPTAAPQPETTPPVAPAVAAAAAATELPRFDDMAERTLGGEASFELPETEALGESFEESAETLYPEFAKPLEIEEDLYLGVEEEAAAEAVPVEAPQEAAPFAPYLSPEEQAYAEPLETYRDYHYDPTIAADELGLPVDLIEEFLGDFIRQSHDFHDSMFEAASKEDYENLKLLSHKLKGVAANLRIEDAFAMLATINTSHNHTEVEANLKMFYNTVARLEGKEPPLAAVARPEPVAGVTAPELPEAEPQIPETAAAPEADIYAFDVKAVAPEQAATPAAGMEAPAEEDIYDFNIKHPEPFELPAESAETEEPEPLPTLPGEETDYGMEALYGFEKEAPEPPSAPEFTEKPTLFEEPELYGETREFELPEMPEAPETVPSEPEAPETVLPEPEPSGPVAEAPEETFPAYDIQSAASELGLPSDIVAELKEDFIDHANSCRERFEEAVGQADPTQWRNEAVQLKGIADNLRMNDIAMMMQELEATDDPLHARALVERFYRRITQL